MGKFAPKLEPFHGKKRKKDKKFAVCDIEASDWSKFAVIGYCDENEYHYFLSMKEFLEFIFKHMTNEKIPDIFAHFGGIYDFMFILKALLEEGYDIDDESMVPRGTGLLCFKAIDPKCPGRTITFRDSSALLPFGLKNLTESFGVDNVKGEFDFKKWDGSITDELLMYLKSDCLGLYQVMEKFYNWPLIKKAGPAMTMASQSMRVLRTFLNDTYTAPGDGVDSFVRKGYFGGRTEIFKPFYKGKKKLKCYDVNSLYPDAMLKNQMPGNFKGWTRNYEPDSFGFYEATVIVPKDMYCPPLPVVTDVGMSKKLVFPTGKLTGVWSTIELEYARSLGVEIVETGLGALFQNGGYIFKDFISTLYDMRLDAKAEGDGVTETLCKLLMNGNYGRWGLNKDKEALVFDDFSEGLKEPSKPLEFDINGQTVRLMIKEKKLEKTFTNVAVAAWVTSLARIHMHKIYMECGDELYYTDTDSIFTTKDFPSGKALGELKLEYESTRAIFLLPKTYCVENEGEGFKKLAMKGFSNRKIQHFGFDDFYTALEGDLRHMKVVHDEKLATMRTAMRRFNTLLTKLPAQTKQINALYDKRTVYRRGQKWDSKPLHYSA